MEYGVGDIVRYETFGGGLRDVTVTHVYTDVKNGEPGFDAELVEPEPHEHPSVWGYDHQITRVWRRADHLDLAERV